MAKPKREGISKKTRFEVFKRDKFTCQYCGKKAPDVVLHIDHIKPVAEGGKSDILNLITACIDCNSGKGARLLSAHVEMSAQREQMEELQDRREQLEMLIEWRSELSDMGVQKSVALERAICDELEWGSLTPVGKGHLKKWLKKFELNELFEALDLAVSQYLKFEQGGATADSKEKAFNYIPRIAGMRRQQAETPWLPNLLYVKGILRNRIYVGEGEANELLEEAFRLGISFETLKQIARSVRNWTIWREEMKNLISSTKEKK